MFDPKKVKLFSMGGHSLEAGEERYAHKVLKSDYDQLLELYNQFKIARPIEEWHEDLGPCLWWDFPICEPPYSGTPLDCDWPEYHTHFTRLTNEMLPRPENNLNISEDMVRRGYKGESK